MSESSAPYLILGGGLAGMAAALPLGERALVLEAAESLGGLVRTHQVQGYWFDTVLHLLHIADDAVLARVESWLGPVLKPIERSASVQTASGLVRYPLQQNLSSLPLDVLVDCIDDLASVSHGPLHAENDDDSFHRRLLCRFGRTLCELFFFPYNEKVWKRSLVELPASGFAWTIPDPGFRQILRGALSSEVNDRSYNSRSWYPSPPPGSSHRGMELLSLAMASRLSRVQTRCVVTRVDPDARELVANTLQGPRCFDWTRGLVSTLPLPALAAMTVGLPVALQQAALRLQHMRVIYLAFCIEGPRPQGCDHWCYHPDPRLSYSRLVYMHRFDSHSAPVGGWGLMAELTERSDLPHGDRQAMLHRVTAELLASDAIGAGCRIVGSHVMDSEYGYVVFDNERDDAVRALEAYYTGHGITLMGRFGRWDYLSMSQVLAEGHAWASEVLASSDDAVQA